MKNHLSFEQLNKLMTKIHQLDPWELDTIGDVSEKKTNEENNYCGCYTVVKLPKEYGEEVYIKFDIYVDSYGDNERIENIQFVKPQRVIVTDFKAY